MRRTVQPRMVEIEPQPRPDEPPAQRLLRRDRERAGRAERRRHGAPAVPRPRAARAAGTPRSRRTPARRRRRGRRAGSRPSARRTATGRAPAPARRPAARTRRSTSVRCGADQREIGVAARLAPDLLARRVGARLRLHQVARAAPSRGCGRGASGEDWRRARDPDRCRPPRPPPDRRPPPARSAAPCARPASTASWSPRAAPPPGGIIAAASQPSTAPASPIVAMRVKRSVRRS